MYKKYRWSVKIAPWSNRFYQEFFLVFICSIKKGKYEKVNQLRISIHNVTCPIIPAYRITGFQS